MTTTTSDNAVLPERKRLALNHLVDASETAALKATFQLLAGLDHEEVRKELDAAHEALWADVVREGNEDVLLPIIARVLLEDARNDAGGQR